MKKLLLMLIFFSLFFKIFAQIIENKPYDISIAEPIFNSTFIKENKIKSITVVLCSKPDNEVIDDKGLVEHFEFDTSGNPNVYYYTQVKDKLRKEIQHPAIYKGVLYCDIAYSQYQAVSHNAE